MDRQAVQRYGSCWRKEVDAAVVETLTRGGCIRSELFIMLFILLVESAQAPEPGNAGGYAVLRCIEFTSWSPHRLRTQVNLRTQVLQVQSGRDPLFE